MSDHDIDRLRAEVERLRRTVHELEAERSGPVSAPDGTRDGERATSRRRLLGGAVAGGAVALLAPKAAAAGTANGDPVHLGEVNVSSETTEIRYDFPIGNVPRGHMFVVQDGAWGAQAPPASATPETGTRAGIGAFTGNDVMHGFFGQSNTAVLGSAGGRFRGQSAFAYGLIAAGRRASMRLLVEDDWGEQIAPPERLDFHNEGEITIDSANELWVCVASGNPGVWRKIAGPDTAGTFHPIEPTRAFDSRRSATPASGLFAGDTNRLVSVADGRDVDTGLVTAAGVVPDGATAVTFNCTVTQTVGAGYVFVAPGDATSITAATVNWSSGGATVGNSGVVKLDGNRRVRVFAAVNATHVVLDVTGYYR